MPLTWLWWAEPSRVYSTHFREKATESRVLVEHLPTYSPTTANFVGAKTNRKQSSYSRFSPSVQLSTSLESQSSVLLVTWFGKQSKNAKLRFCYSTWKIVKSAVHTLCFRSELATSVCNRIRKFCNVRKQSYVLVFLQYLVCPRNVSGLALTRSAP